MIFNRWNGKKFRESKNIYESRLTISFSKKRKEEKEEEEVEEERIRGCNRNVDQTSFFLKKF